MRYILNIPESVMNDTTQYIKYPFRGKSVEMVSRPHLVQYKNPRGGGEILIPSLIPENVRYGVNVINRDVELQIDLYKVCKFLGFTSNRVISFLIRIELMDESGYPDKANFFTLEKSIPDLYNYDDLNIVSSMKGPSTDEIHSKKIVPAYIYSIAITLSDLSGKTLTLSGAYHEWGNDNIGTREIYEASGSYGCSSNYEFEKSGRGDRVSFRVSQFLTDSLYSISIS